MKAWEVHNSFGIDSLTLVEKSEPKPGPGQVAELHPPSHRHGRVQVHHGRAGSVEGAARGIARCAGVVRAPVMLSVRCAEGRRVLGVAPDRSALWRAWFCAGCGSRSTPVVPA